MREVLKYLAIVAVFALIAAWLSATSGYLVNGNDIDTYFAPYSSGGKASVTGFQVGGTDLKDRYAPYTSGGKAGATGYLSGSTDLKDIFQKNATTSTSTTTTTTSTTSTTSSTTSTTSSTTSTTSSTTSTTSSTTSTTSVPSLSAAVDMTYTQADGPIPLISNPVTCTASGGTAPYTYQWHYVSGSTTFGPTSSTSASTTWFLTVYGHYVAVWYCTVTDAALNTANTAAVTVDLYAHP